MGNRTIVVSVVFFVSILIVIVFYGQQKAQWKGKIGEENGVKVIKNPTEPLYGEIEFELEEDLSIGNKEDENYAFSRAAFLYVDSKGNIYVIDRGKSRIQKFDNTGKYLQTIGGQGGIGSGGFERISALQVDVKDQIYIEDGGSIQVFDKSGNFIKIIETDEHKRPLMRQFGITKEGNIIGRTITKGKRRSDKRGDYDSISHIDLFSSEGKLIKTIATYRREQGSPLMDGQRIIYPYNQHGSQLCFCQIDNEISVYGYGSAYRLFAVSPSGNIIYIIDKDETSQSLTQKDINKVMDWFMENLKKYKRETEFSKDEINKAMNFPKYKPFFDDILSDDRGRIYVKRFKSKLDEEKNISYDLFSKDGYYLYNTKLSVRLPLIRHGEIYTTEYDQETLFLKVKRYKIKNWDQIKEGI